MYFQLLCGVHRQLNKKTGKYDVFTVQIERNGMGQVTNMIQPIVESEKNLVNLFGSNKFRCLSNREAMLALASQRALVTDSNSDVAKAAADGAEGISLGKDITNKYPKASKFNLAVYQHDEIGYTVIDAESGIPAFGPTENVEDVKKFIDNCTVVK